MVNQEITIYKLLMWFVKDESGATAIEYGLIAAGVSVAIISVVKGLGTNLKTTFWHRPNRTQITDFGFTGERSAGALPMPDREWR
jgi:pilus assembly protein Flp/PilA